MHRLAAHRRTLVLPAFLAPSLIARASTSTTPLRRKSKATPQSSVDATAFERLKQQITFVHSPQVRGISAPQADVFNTTLVEIRQASSRNDAHSLRECWRRLEQNKLLPLLGASQLGAISMLLASSFSPKNYKQTWDPTNRKLVEDAALLAAAARSTDALNACMLLHIKQNNPEAVLALYERFMKLLGERELWYDNVAEELQSPSNAALAADRSLHTRRTPHIPGRTTILLAATVAYAMQDSFQSALQTCLLTTVMFHAQTTNLYMKNLGHNPKLRQKVETYVKRLNLARLVARPPSLSRHITNLAGAPSENLLLSLYESIIEGLSGPDAFLAAEPVAITSSKSVALTEVGWTSLLTAFLKFRRKDLASKLWEDMTGLGVKPGVSMWTALLDSYGDMRAVDEAKAGWGMMIAQGVKPDGLTYRALISALFKGRKSDEAMNLFQTFRTNFQKECPAPHTLSVYNTVLHNLLYMNRIDEATAIMQIMHDKGPTPDLVSYNTFLGYYGRRGDFKGLASVVDKMASVNIAGDVFSFSTVLSALLKAGREDAPDMVLSIMRKQGVQPNVATFSAIIDHQMREQNEKNLRAAMRILHRMEQEENIRPNEVTYTSILAGLYRGDWLPIEQAQECRRDIIERMKQRGIKFTLPTYHILIKSCLEYPHPEGLQHALSYFQEMVDRKIGQVQITWYILLAGLLQRGEWGLANEKVRDMYLSGVEPVGALSELVGKIKKRMVQ